MLSFIILVLSRSACTELLIAGGTIPAKTCISSTIELLELPVTSRYVSLSATSILDTEPSADITTKNSF